MEAETILEANPLEADGGEPGRLNRPPRIQACLSSFVRSPRRIGQQLLHYSYASYLGACDRVRAQLCAPPTIEKEIPYSLFDRSWREFKLNCEHEVHRSQVLPTMSNDGVFGYLLSHLRLKNHPRRVEPLISNGVLEIRLKNTGLVVATRDEAVLSPDYVNGVRSLALCLMCDVLFWPYFLWCFEKMMGPDPPSDQFFLFTGLVPSLVGLGFMLLEMWYLRRQLIWWRLFVLAFAYAIGRVWETVLALPPQKE